MTRPTPPAPTNPRRKALGDFQTPPGLVARVLDVLGPFGGRYPRVLEPTCGRGQFVAGLLERPDPPREVLGFEIQADHAAAARLVAEAHPAIRTNIETADLFGVDLARGLRWSASGPLLVVGNLPWVTVAGLGAAGEGSGPERSNERGARGIDAMLGGSNFDLSESLWLKLIRELAAERPTIALLGKSAVARGILRSVEALDLPIRSATLWRVDAARWFGASVDACLLRVEVGPGPKVAAVPSFPDLAADRPTATLGLVGGDLIADLDAYDRSRFADGPCPLTWRQGVKHDASAVMELVRGDDGRLRNGLGEEVDVEPDRVYPLLKSTDLAGAVRPRPRRSLIVTQRSLGEATAALTSTAPRLWDYLSRHRDRFERRKSSIYRGRPPFSVFGVGPYAFSPHKVAISGLHKAPRFVALGPVDGRPTLLDDTCYFLPCRDAGQAGTLAGVLNGPAALDLIRALVFWDAKRPITQKLLRRLDLRALLHQAGLAGSWRDDWAAVWLNTPRPLPAPGVP